MERILVSHWNILQQDPHQRTNNPECPRVTYHRAPNLKNKIAPSKFKSSIAPHVRPVLIPLVGMYQCNKAFSKTCKFVQHGKKSFSTKGKTYQLKELFFRFRSIWAHLSLQCNLCRLHYPASPLSMNIPSTCLLIFCVLFL